MKKLLLALLLAGLVSPAFAATVFFWRAEGTTLDATNDKTTGDTTATTSGSISVSNAAERTGTNGLLRVTSTTSSMDFDATAIWPSAATPANSVFSLAFSFNHQTAVTGNGLIMGLRARDGSNNDGFQVQTAASGQGGGQNMVLRIGNGTTAVTLTTDSAAMTAGNWYAVVVRVDVPNDDRWIGIYDASGTLLDSAEDLTTDLGAHAPTDINLLQLGAGSASQTHETWFDTFIISDTYAAPLENFLTAAQFDPTFTAGPTPGTETDTTLPFTFTSSQNGTAYGVACTNGQTATHSQTLAGNCSGGAAVASWSEVVVGGVADGATFAGLTGSTTYDVYITQVSDLGGPLAAVSSHPDRTTAAPAGAAPTWAAGPTVTPTTNGFIIGGTLDTADATVYAAWCNPGDAAPNEGELDSGQCGGGNAAIVDASEAWVDGVANTFNLTAANKPPRANVYVFAINGAGDTAISTFSNQDRSADAGQAIFVPSSLAATSIFDCATCINGGSADAYFDPDFAVGDAIEHDLTTQVAGCGVSFEADGDLVYTPGSPGDCDGQQYFGISYQDVSSTTTGLFTAPATGNFTTDDLIYNGNTAPVCTGLEMLLLDEDAVMSALDLTQFCEDVNGDTLTFAVTAGILPNGTALSGAGLWDGTPDSEDEGGEVLTFEACDPADDCDTFDVTVYVVNTWATPNCVGDTLTECADEIVAAAPWRVNDMGLSLSAMNCSASTPGDIISQDPAAATQIEPFEEISVTTARSCAVGRGGVTLRLDLGL